MAEDDIYRRRRAWELRKAGHSVNSICTELKCDDKFVAKWFQRGQAGKGFHDSQRPGAPPKLTPALESKVKRILKRTRDGSADKVAKILKTENDIDIGGRTIRRYARKLGLKSYVRPMKPRLVKDDAKRRLAFAQKRRPRGFWKNIFWTDETTYELHSDNRKIWAERIEDVPPREKDLVEKTVRVWIGISFKGKAKLFKIPSGWKSPDYVQFLKTKGVPTMIKVAGKDFILMHDGDGAHRGREVQKYFNEAGIKTLDGCPARSPDIWPHENAIKILDDGLKNRKYSTIDGLWKVLQEEWEKIPHETIVKLVMDVPSRLREVIALNGAITRH